MGFCSSAELMIIIVVDLAVGIPKLQEARIEPFIQMEEGPLTN